MKKSKEKFLVLGLVALSSSVWAAEVEPIITDRPDFTESTETVPLGMTQIEGGFTFAQSGGEKSDSFGELLIRHALGRQTELRLEIPNYARVRGEDGRVSGFEDGSIGFKQVLSTGSEEFGFRKPRVSLIGSLALPLGSSSFRSSGLQGEAKLLLGVDLSKRLSLASNLNYASLKDENGRFGEFSASASLGYSLSNRVGSYLEVYGFFPAGGRADSKFINGGFTYGINDDFQLDARVGFGLNPDVKGNDQFFGLGAARRF